MQESIKIPDSVIISGLTKTETDNELEKYLATFGSINRVFYIGNPKSEYHGLAIVEFTHGTAMQSLSPLLPLLYNSPTKSEVTYNLCSMASMYSPLACSSATKSDIEELQAIAKLTGKPFEILLQEELAKFSPQSPSLSREMKTELKSGEQAPPSTKEPAVKCHPKDSPVKVNPAQPEPSPASLITDFASFFVPPTTVKHPPALSGDVFNPPEVQKVIVEHIVKTDNAVSHRHGSSRLRAFSGKITRPSHEAD